MIEWDCFTKMRSNINDIDYFEKMSIVADPQWHSLVNHHNSLLPCDCLTILDLAVGLGNVRREALLQLEANRAVQDPTRKAPSRQGECIS